MRPSLSLNERVDLNDHADNVTGNLGRVTRTVVPVEFGEVEVRVATMATIRQRWMFYRAVDDDV